ncbi:SDR family NAD(P)-dependent oxidoreductase [Haliangium sp.]|uniref:SDR family NAD(P)-dependent oxidoreductase n=1 Tax=Haliangium sp. TaxID=2663208 RepID=UPI003D0EABDC
MTKRVAVVTGANRGLGLATSRALAEHGYRVVLAARDRDRAETAAAALAADGLDAVPAQLDVADPAGVDSFMAELRDRHGRIDVLVNNAGTVFEGIREVGPEQTSPLRVSAEVMLAAFENNTLGAYRLIQACLPMMNQAGYGRIVNVSSGMGGLDDMGPGWPAYRMSKTGLNVLTRVFAHEAAEGVKINSVCPGWVRTDMGGPNATRSIADGIRGIVWAATLPEDGPSGGFFRDGQPIDW